MDCLSYFNAVTPYYLSTGRLMSPGELGCALSHKKVWELISKGGNETGVVLEDDALLDDQFGARINAIVSDPRLDEYFVSLGGQESQLASARELTGRTIDGIPDTWELSPLCLNKLFGAVGYAIRRDTARSLSNYADRGAFIVDDFVKLFESRVISRFAISNVVGHPWIEVPSQIEAERSKLQQPYIGAGRSLLGRLAREVRLTLTARTWAAARKREFGTATSVAWDSRFRTD
jgi:glycosyl transferase family 25